MLARLAKRFAADLYGAAKPWAHMVGFYAVAGSVLIYGATHQPPPIPLASEVVPARVNEIGGGCAGGNFDIKDRCARFAEQHIQGPAPVVQAAVDACRIEFQTADRSHI